MMTSYSRKRAAIAANEVFALTLVEAGCSAQILQDTESRFDPLFSIFVFNFWAMRIRNLSTDLAHSRSQFSAR